MRFSRRRGIHIVVFWVITAPRFLVYGYHHFGGMCSLRLEGNSQGLKPLVRVCISMSSLCLVKDLPLLRPSPFQVTKQLSTHLRLYSPSAPSSLFQFLNPYTQTTVDKPKTKGNALAPGSEI
jgi:hypothetical protein